MVKDNSLVFLIHFNNWPLAFFMTGITVVYIFYVLLGFDPNTDTVVLHSGHALLLVSLLLGLLQNKMDLLLPKYRIWFYLLLTYVFFLTILGLINGNFSQNRYYFATDISSFAYFSGLLVAIERKNWRFVDSLLLYQFIIGTYLCIFAMLMYQVPLLYQYVIWTPLYNFWGLLYAAPYFLLTLSNRGTLIKLLIIIGVSIHFILVILALKRIFVGELFLLTVLYMYLKYRHGKYVSWRQINIFKGVLGFIGLFLLAIIVIQIGQYLSHSAEYGSGYGLSGLQHRFTRNEGLLITTSEDYRLKYEPATVLEQLSGYSVIFGEGIGAVIPVSILHSPTGSAGDLHNGLAKIFLKGGILFLILWLYIWFVFLKDCLNNRNERLIPNYIVVLVNVILMIVKTVIVSFPSFGLFMFCAGYCMSREREIEN